MLSRGTVMLVEQVGRLTVIRPGQAQVYRQIAANLPIIAAIDERVMLTEIETGISGSNLYAVRLIVDKSSASTNVTPAIKPVGSIDVRQEDVG